MTTIINRQACSESFLAAFDALEAGKAVRRGSWPEGQYLKKHTTGAIAVFRNHALSAPGWAGPVGGEQDALDWCTIDVPV